MHIDKLIAVIIGLDNIFVGIKVASISVDKFLLLIFLCLQTKKINNIFRADDRIRYVCYLLGILLLLSLLSATKLTLHNELSGLLQVTRVFMFIACIFAGYLVSYKNPEQNINIILIPILLSCVIAILQHPITPLSEFAIQLKIDYFSMNMNEVISARMVDVVQRNYFMPRVSGFYGFSIILSYVSIHAFFLVTILTRINRRKIYILYILIIALAAFLTLTRSVLPALLIFVLYFISIQQKKTRRVIYLSLSVVTFTLITKSNIDIDILRVIGRVFQIADDSASARLPLAITGLWALAEHFPIPSLAEYMLIREKSYLIYGHKEILEDASHNALVNLGLKYSFLVSFLLPFFFLILIKKETSKSTIFFVGLILYVLSYLAHSLVHNQGLFISDYFIFYCIGIYLGVTELKKNSA